MNEERQLPRRGTRYTIRLTERGADLLKDWVDGQDLHAEMACTDMPLKDGLHDIGVSAILLTSDKGDIYINPDDLDDENYGEDVECLMIPSHHFVGYSSSWVE